MSEAVGISTGSLLVLLLGVRNKEMNERIMGGEGIIIQKHPQMLKQLKKGSNRVLKKILKKEANQIFPVVLQMSAPKLAGNKSPLWGSQAGQSETCLHQESQNILN